VQRWVEKRTFIWLISDEVLEEYREVLARLDVRRREDCLQEADLPLPIRMSRSGLLPVSRRSRSYRIAAQRMYSLSSAMRFFGMRH